MNKNIFIKKKMEKNEKFNPDIDLILEKNIKDRNVVIERTNEQYKSIIDQKMTSIKTQKDLEIPLNNNNKDINIMLSKTSKDREELDSTLATIYSDKYKQENQNKFSHKLLMLKMMSFNVDDYTELRTTRDDYYTEFTNNMKKNEDKYNNIFMQINSTS
jgi:hypothetical protein